MKWFMTENEEVSIADASDEFLDFFGFEKKRLNQ